VRPTRASLAALVAAFAGLAVAGCGGSEAGPVELAFVSTRDGDYAIYGIDAEGRGQRRLTEERGDTSSARGLFFQIEPAWSPDGNEIAFASKREGSFDLFVMASDGSGTRRLTATKSQDGNPSWSPDGKRLVFDRDDDLYVVSADGSGARRLGADSAEERDPAWSPDGEWIAYVRRTPGTTARELWLVRPDGSERHALTSLSSSLFSPSWSPDSGRIVFAAAIDVLTYDLYTIGVDGKGMRRLTSSPEDAFEPAWSPDGRTIAFSREGAVEALTLEGSAVEALTSTDTNDSSPAWNPEPSADEE
jgi:Tol biopolymer transport system component